MLGASLAVKIYREPVDSLESLLKSDYQILVVNGSSISRYFSEANPDTVQGQIWSQKMTSANAFIESTQVKSLLLKNSIIKNNFPVDNG